MAITIDVGTYNVPLGRAAKYGTLPANAEDFPDAVRVHIWNYGLRQILNDAIADKTDGDETLSNEAIVAKAKKRLDALRAGELRVARATEPFDPVDRVLHKLARDAVAAHIRESDEYKAIKPEKGKDRVLAALQKRNGAEMTWEKAIATWIAAVPALRKEAERLVKQSDEAAKMVAI